MALENAPWAVDGAKHSAAVARTLAYASTSGAEGIVEPADLRVRATQTPSGSVRVAPGGIAILNRAPNGGQQTYTARNVSETLVEVQPTGSGGGRTDYVWAHIIDPEYGGQFPENPQTAQYFFLTASAAQPEGNGWYRLARIDIPASTATITQAMITDLREVANPRTLDVWRPRASVREDTEELTAYQDGDGEWFPNAGGEQQVFIPEWATRVQIAATWMGVRIAKGKNGWGEYWVEFGPYLRQSVREFSTQRYQWDTVGATATAYREPWIMEDDRYIPERIRGTTQPFIMKALRSPDSDNAVAKIDFKSGVSLKVRFLEVADPSSS